MSGLPRVRSEMKNKLFYLAFICVIIGLLVIVISGFYNHPMPWWRVAIGCGFYLAGVVLLTIRMLRGPR